MVNPSDRGISVPSSRPTDRPVISERSYIVHENQRDDKYSSLSYIVNEGRDSVKEFFSNAPAEPHDNDREFNGPAASNPHDEGREFYSSAPAEVHNENRNFNGPAVSNPHNENRIFNGPEMSSPHPDTRDFRGPEMSRSHPDTRDFRGPEIASPHDNDREFNGPEASNPHNLNIDYKGPAESKPHDLDIDYKSNKESSPHNLGIDYKSNAVSNPHNLNIDYKSNVASTPNPTDKDYKGPAESPNPYYERDELGRVINRRNPASKDSKFYNMEWSSKLGKYTPRLPGRADVKDSEYYNMEWSSKLGIYTPTLPGNVVPERNPYNEGYASIEKQSTDDIHRPIKAVKYKSNGYKDVNLKETLEANNIFGRGNMPIYNKFNRFGFINPYDGLSNTKEYLFFTKPDLHILDVSNPNALNSEISGLPFFADILSRYPDIPPQLQSSGGTNTQKSNPFMTLLSNHVKNTMDLPSIQGREIETAANAYGTSIPYRGSGYKSDENVDISLEFEDTKYLDVYMLLRTYEEYIRAKENGNVTPPNIGLNNGTLSVDESTGVSFNRYIRNKELHDRFSIYKIIVDEDYETILFWAKAIGCYINSVPRDAFSDLREGGTLKFTVEIKAPFVRDMNPIDIYGFNNLIYSHRQSLITANNQIPLYKDYMGNKGTLGTGMMNTTWANTPYIQVVQQEKVNYKWLAPQKMDYVYKLRWY